MAYKQKGCTPITAKLQKTTKGGVVQQPLLNMGAPVKMKMTSPAKQGGKDDRSSNNKLKAAARKANEDAKAKRQNELDKAKPLSEYLPTTRKAVEKRMKAFDQEAARRQVTKEIGAQVDKNNATKKAGPAVTAGFASISPFDGYFGNTSGKDKPKDPNRKDKPKDPNRIDFPMEPKKGNKKDAVNSSKPSKVTGKAGSDLRRQQYDKLGWKYDSTINAPKERKKVEAIKPNAKAKTVSMETKSEIVLPNKPVQVKNVEKAVKKIDVAENKETRAAKVRAKGEKALAEGNKDKALRLKRREERISSRAQKKKSQASKAIGLN